MSRSLISPPIGKILQRGSFSCSVKYDFSPRAKLSKTTTSATSSLSNSATTKNIVLSGGLEFRRGHNRLQGYYGGEALVTFDGNSTKYTWGRKNKKHGEI